MKHDGAIADLHEASATEQAAIATAAVAADQAEFSRIRQWIVDHDNSWLFIICYVSLALVLSIWISLFWLVAVVAMHFLLELVRQSWLAPAPTAVLTRALWELKLDVALVLFALAVAAYMEFVLGVAGVGGAARLGAQSAPRVAGWTRAVRGVLLSVDDVAQVGRAAMVRKADDATAALPPEVAGMERRPAWCFSDHLAIWLGIICAALILLAPALTDHSPATLADTLLAELHPWPAAQPE